MTTAPQPRDWIRAYAQVQVATDQQIAAMLANATDAMRTDLARILSRASLSTGDAIRIQQMLTVRKALLERQSEVLRRLGKVVEARRLEATARAIQLGNEADAFVLERLGQNQLAFEVLNNLKFGLARTTEVALARMNYSYTELADRIYNNDVWLGSRIDQRITALLAQGKSAREFAAEAVDWFNPNTPGGVRYAAMRLARSEINNAFHAVSVQQVQDKPWTHAMQWHLSGSHPKPDICDEYAKEDGFDKGPGVFPKGEVPRKPHSHCLCYVTGVDIDEDEFLSALTSGKYNAWIDRQRAMANERQPVVPPVIRAKVAAGGNNPAIHDLKRSYGDFERNPRLMASMSSVQVKKIARAYGIDPLGSKEAVEDRLLRHMRGMSKPPAPTLKAAVKETKAPTPKPTPSIPVPQPTESLLSPSIVTKSSRNQERMEAAVRRQSEIAPKSLSTLRSASEMTAQEKAEFTARFGPSSIGGYVDGERRIVLHPSVFTDSSTKQLLKEVKSGYSSQIGEGVFGLDGTFAHEFGHHVYAMAELGGPQAIKPIWDTLAAELDISRPLLYDATSLDRWVTRNSGVLSRAVGKYGVTDSEELMAEIWAEYSTNPLARTHISSVGDVLRTVAEDSVRT